MRSTPVNSDVRTTFVVAMILASVVTMLYLVDRPVSASKSGKISALPTAGLSVVQPKIATPFDPINHIIVIYQENWSFDALYGNFPGANGYNHVPAGSPAGSVSAATQLTNFPQIDVFSGATGPAPAPFNNQAGGYGQLFSAANRVVPQPINSAGTGPDGAFSPFNGMAVPYNLAYYIQPTAITGDIVHRFYTEQSQIDGGKMDKFVSLSDNPGLVMSGFDATNMPEGLLAQQYVMCDNFFHAAFGGSFLNHQWLIAAQSPTYASAASVIKQKSTLGIGGVLVNGNDGFDVNGNPGDTTAPIAVKSLGQSNVGGGTNDHIVTVDGYAVNTIQTVNAPHATGNPTLLPNQTNQTIGDSLTEKNVSWKWYSGGWDAALANNPDPLFQFHHQPFAYYQNFADGTPAKAAHLQDETQFLVDLAANKVPNVVFIKPIGANNEHPGYASIAQGQQHVASLVNAIQNSSTWKDCVIIITYDEHGGHYDHVAPPGQPLHVGGNGKMLTHDQFGPGSRVPTIIISPFAKQGVVDHTEYDTTSILATIEQRYGLAPLGTRDGAVNTLINAFNFNQPVLASVTANPLPASPSQPVNFSVAATSPSNATLTYTWTFGDQITVSPPPTATGANVSHTYSVPGVYTATVSVFDGTNTVTGKVSVTVNSAPVLVAAATANPSSTVINTNVGFSALASSPAGLTLTYTWNFGDGSPMVTGASVKHQYVNAGIYTATVSITDGSYPAVTSSTRVTINATNNPPAGLSNIQHVIVIYQENWSFDALYGNFPGANGLANAAAQIAAHPQIDVFSTPYGQPFGGTNRTVPQPINGSTPDGNFANFPGTAVPYPLTNFITPDKLTGDIVHRFHTEQAQIDGGKMDKFVSLSDNPGLVLSGFDATNMPEGLLAQQYVLCDNFFHAAFGGSFLNHQWLIAAQSPVYAAAPSSVVQPAGTNSLNGNQGFNANGDPFNVSKLSLGQSSVNGNPVDSTVTTDGFAVNTIQTVNNPHGATTTLLLPNQTNVTIGDRLNDAGLSWTWYSGGWDAALSGNADSLFQYHHQPFAYYQNYADGTAAKATHLKDETKFFSDLTNLSLPSVVFIKPIGPNNEHPGYAALTAGQAHVASLVQAVQASQYWQNSVIIITYDEHGGRYDHVAPPSAATNAPAGTYDRWGPGVRVPAIIISPFSKKSFVDHTAYDTTSILRFIEKRWNLPALSTRDAAVNSLDNALNFTQPPVVTSAIANPSIAGVGQTVAFTAVASSPTSSPLTYSWNFGDNTPSATGNAVNHVYATAGTYTVMLSVADTLNPPVIQTLTVTINNPVIGTGKDSDGDGFSDAVENLFGSNPNDATSSPLSGKAAGTPTATNFTKVSVKLNFDANKTFTDSFAFSGTLPVPSGFSPNGQKLLIDFGGEIRVLTLNSKGKSPAGNDSFVLNKAKNGAAAFKATFKNASLATSLAADGLTNANASKKSVSIPITLSFNGVLYTKTVTLLYSATANGKAIAK